MSHSRLLLTAAVFLAGATQAAAFCSEPSAPFGRPTKPNIPYCVNTYSNTHTCDSWEIDSYNSQIDAFNDDYSRYVRRLNEYIDEAVEYAKCEIEKFED